MPVTLEAVEFTATAAVIGSLLVFLGVFLQTRQQYRKTGSETSVNQQEVDIKRIDSLIAENKQVREEMQTLREDMQKLWEDNRKLRGEFEAAEKRHEDDRMEWNTKERAYLAALTQKDGEIADKERQIGHWHGEFDRVNAECQFALEAQAAAEAGLRTANQTIATLCPPNYDNPNAA